MTISLYEIISWILVPCSDQLFHHNGSAAESVLLLDATLQLQLVLFIYKGHILLWSQGKHGSNYQCF